MSKPLKVLIVEDCEDDAQLLLRELRRGGFDPSWARVDDSKGMSAALEREEWQVILSDHSMPRFNAPRALELVQARDMDVPFIIVSGSIGEEQAVAAMRAGASDYLVKGSLGRLATAIERELTQARIRVERRSAELRQRVAEQQLAHMAAHDRLTGLPNRGSFETQIEQALVQQGSKSAQLSVMHLALDGFNVITNTLGQEKGDLVLREVARRLRAALPLSDSIACLGRDEFGILVPGGRASRHMQIARELLKALETPVDVGGIPVRLDASIGATTCPAQAVGVSTLLRFASVALQDARRTGQPLSTYSTECDPFDPTALALLGELAGAIHNGELRAEFQPIVDPMSEEVVGAEALVRWLHPRLGKVAPGRFVPAAESCGLIQPLFTNVLAMSIAQWQTWHIQGFDLSVAVNLSARNLTDPDTLVFIHRLIDQQDLPPGALELELTESAVMADPARSIRALTALREHGVRLAIDDFGTGLSSLGYLRDLPVDKLKVDRTFVSRMLDSEKDAAIVRATIDLGHTLGLQVVAEGVENKITFDILAALGCDLIQGYFLAQSMTDEDLQRWARSSGWTLRTMSSSAQSSRTGQTE
jgi:diguanylate cyclase